MINASPVRSRVVQKARGRLAVEDFALRTVVAAPATTVAPPPKPTYDDADLARVTGCGALSTLADHWAWLAGTTAYGPSRAFLLPDMWMVDGNLARGRARFEMNTEAERLVVRRRDEARVEGAAFASSSYGNLFFGHGMLDDHVTALLAPDFGDPHFVNPPVSDQAHLAEYRRLADLELPSVWTAPTSGCWVFHDPFLNDSKVARLRELRRRLVEAGGSTEAGPRRVYVRRGADGADRDPRNEQLVCDALAADGWQVLDTTAPAAVLHATFRRADVVVGVEGSHLAHALLGQPEGAALVELMPPNHFNLVLKDFVDRLGLRLGFHVGTQDDEGWTVDLDAIRRLADTLDVHAGA